MIIEFQIKLGEETLKGSVKTDNLEISYAKSKKREKILKEIIKNNIEVVEMKVKYED